MVLKRHCAPPNGIALDISAMHKTKHQYAVAMSTVAISALPKPACSDLFHPIYCPPRAIDIPSAHKYRVGRLSLFTSS